MSSSRSLTSIDVSEYDRIEAAMTESERGRWFLDEYVRRNRTTDTEILLGAIARLESVVTGDRESGQIGRVRGDLMDMAHAIARTKAEINAISAPDHEQTRLGGASMALDAIVRSTERATSDILSAAEDVQEAAWTLRESGSDAAACDTLDRRATEIYTACSFQDLTAQRTARIIHTLRYLEERLAAMMSIWGDALDTVPQAPGAAAAPTADLSQSDVDRFIDLESGPAFDEAAPPRALQALASADDIIFIETSEPEPDASAEPESEAVAEAIPAAEEAMIVASLDEMEPVGEPEPIVATPPESPVEKIDIAAAFADIDGLSDDEKRALFS
ncbi:hypothetical protein G3T14_06485 [Methylobacterium sp. BTF04]|uniref:hypothetical protein n=1 Tax=Methylobacterium sp. BTF04 TaxID=2708300 RepID=UPI0013D5F2C6|nr:hypothetical protein [Methylobacterium sp. BTF04]NEU11776.1 hypothetical protein [Methylobacterium sp. BTF04]